MQVTFLLGPAGSGKTHRCLAEVRAALQASAEGLPLLFLAPRQATFQLERQLLAGPDLPGYTRLQILSFARLAEFVLSELSPAPPRLLSEEGRVMVLRALLARKQNELQIFRATARLPGFAQQLSEVLRELQEHRLSPARLRTAAQAIVSRPELAAKLHDVALLLEAYLDWLQENGLQDAHCLLDLATEALKSPIANRQSPIALAGLWLDGFAEMTPQELDLLAAVAPLCEQATLAFCLEDEPRGDVSWLSTWSIVSQTYRQCRARLDALPDCKVTVETLPRDRSNDRFAGNPMLGHLEKFWTKPKVGPAQAEACGYSQAEQPFTQPATRSTEPALRLVVCANPEAEATLAAREVLRFVRAGARFRDCAVLLRTFEGYHDALRRAFTRYEIPFFLDRREPVAHHPLAELTRFALRTVAFGWRREDWFGALKTGMAPVGEAEIDELENEALARGWEGAAWQHPLSIAGDSPRGRRLERTRQAVVPPFERLVKRLAVDTAARPGNSTGAELAGALREFWTALRVEEQLEEWAVAGITEPTIPISNAVHETVWEQMLAWLDNLALAFPNEPMPLRDWLPILEAGLAGLTVGMVPPALDQVLIGTVDRSRNPELKLALVLGLNESVFPASPAPAVVLTDTDRAALEEQKIFVGAKRLLRLGRERYYGYIAFTRARRRLVLTCATFDTQERKRNPSAFLRDLKRLFPDLEPESFFNPRDWRQSEHVSELMAPLLRNEAGGAGSRGPGLSALATLPSVAPLLEQLKQIPTPSLDEPLSPALVGQLYGRELETSVTSLEIFAECPFRFFVQAGLRAQERLRFEADSRQAGTFQHAALKSFHEELRGENKAWREVAPAEARARIRRIAEELASRFGNGVLRATEQSRFLARTMTAALEDFIETVVGWINQQYEFNPTAAELRFDSQGDVPAWRLPLSDGRFLIFRGVIDRVDLFAGPDKSSALCVVVDYKSSAKKIDPRLLENGIQMQLPAYLSVLRHLPDPQRVFGVRKLVPAGVFYVNLRGQYPRGGHRNEVLAERDDARRLAYRHSGRFDAAVLPHLDNRPPIPGGEKTGDQFNFKITATGKLHGTYKDPMPAEDFLRLLDQVEAQLRQMGERIFRGETRVDPYRQGIRTPCDFCDYRPVCRIDPWTHEYRALREPRKGSA